MRWENDADQCLDTIAKDRANLIESLVAFAIVLVAVLPIIAWRGYALSVLWAWFAVPLGAPAIGAAHFVGLFAIVALVRERESDHSESREPLRDALTTIIRRAMLPGLCLAIGAAAAWWMG